MNLADIQFVDTFLQLRLDEHQFTVDVGEASKVKVCEELLHFCLSPDGRKIGAEFCEAARAMLDELLEEGAFERIFGERRNNDLAVGQICGRIAEAFFVRRGQITAQIWVNFRKEVDASLESMQVRAADDDAPPPIQ